MSVKRSGAGLFLLLAVLIPPKADDRPEVLQLARFREKFRQDIARLPNYTCLETMQRSQRTPPAHTFSPVDTVRVEISTVGGKEIYAWPGARRFDDKQLRDFVTKGATATGMFFSTMSNDLFAGAKAALEYRGDEKLEGRSLVRYDYRIPQFVSDLILRVGDASATVASKGSFWFDPVSLDLVRVDTYGDDMPETLNLAQAMMTVHYARARIGNSDVLLPQKGEMQLSHFSGSASRNTIEFSQCRAYQSESTISFDEPSPSAAPPTPAVRQVVLPLGLLVPVVLETALDSKTAALGDPIRARVREDVRSEGGFVLPAGAVIHGRIVRLDRASMTAPYFVVGVELFEAEWGNSRADFYGELVESYARKGIRAGFAARGRVTYILQGKTFHIDAGLGLLWRILDRPAEPSHQAR